MSLILKGIKKQKILQKFSKCLKNNGTFCNISQKNSKQVIKRKKTATFYIKNYEKEGFLEILPYLVLLCNSLYYITLHNSVSVYQQMAFRFTNKFACF